MLARKVNSAITLIIDVTLVLYVMIYLSSYFCYNENSVKLDISKKNTSVSIHADFSNLVTLNVKQITVFVIARHHGQEHIVLQRLLQRSAAKEHNWIINDEAVIEPECDVSFAWEIGPYIGMIRKQSPKEKLEESDL